jgi:hypothetical protein
MRDQTIKQQEISDKIKILSKAIESTRNIKNTLNLPNTFQFSNKDKKILQNAESLLKKESITQNNIEQFNNAITQVNQIWIRYEKKS